MDQSRCVSLQSLDELPVWPICYSLKFCTFSKHYQHTDYDVLFTGLAQLDKNLISEINEYYLLHGTKPDLIERITHDSVDFRMASDKPMFGRGAYYAESSTKADQYAGNCEVTEWSQK